VSDIVHVLAESRLFGGLSEEHLERIRNIAIDRRLRKGEILFFDGDAGNGFYLVAAGSVKVYKVSAEGKEQILHIVREGDSIGAVPVFSGTSFPANAQAISKCHLLFFPRTAFIDLIKDDLSLTMNIMALLSMRLREFTVQIENLTLKEIPARLAAYLLYLSEEQGSNDAVELKISKLQLANILGTGPESLSRALGNLKAQQLITAEGQKIGLLDRIGLEELAEYGKNLK